MCFIENNANLSIGDKFDLTPLLLAVSCGLKNVVTLLLSKKVDSKVKTKMISLDCSEFFVTFNMLYTGSGGDRGKQCILSATVA